MKLDICGMGLVYQTSSLISLDMKTKDKKLLACFSDTPSDLVFWSFRYFLGRMTIHACCFAEDLARGWEHLDPIVQERIKSELEKEFEQDDRVRKLELEEPKKAYNYYLPLGHDSEREAWQKVRDAYTKL